MTALYWTITGFDIWRLDEVTTIKLKNLNTGEELKCETITDVREQKFHPVTMPKVNKKKAAAPKKEKAGKAKSAKKRKYKIAESDKKKSKYKGVRRTGKKFSGQYWDGKKKRLIHLGTFEAELLAASAVQEALGNKAEAKRLRNEYEEGDRSPEPEETLHKNILGQETF